MTCLLPVHGVSPHPKTARRYYYHRCLICLHILVMRLWGGVNYAIEPWLNICGYSIVVSTSRCGMLDFKSS